MSDDDAAERAVAAEDPAADAKTLEILRARAERFARRPEEEGEESIQVIEFARGEGRFAVCLDDTLAVRQLATFCPIPGASPVVPGVFYHRGRILSAHDLGPLLTSGAASEAVRWVVICHHGAFQFGLIADEVHDVSELRGSEMRELPISFGDRRGCFQGLTDREVLVLDLGQLLNEREFVEAFG